MEGHGNIRRVVRNTCTALPGSDVVTIHLGEEPSHSVEEGLELLLAVHGRFLAYSHPARVAAS